LLTASRQNTDRPRVEKEIAEGALGKELFAQVNSDQSGQSYQAASEQEK
jgi:hypothetical protein